MIVQLVGCLLCTRPTEVWFSIPWSPLGTAKSNSWIQSQDFFCAFPGQTKKQTRKNSSKYIRRCCQASSNSINSTFWEPHLALLKGYSCLYSMESLMECLEDQIGCQGSNIGRSEYKASTYLLYYHSGPANTHIINKIIHLTISLPYIRL